MDSKTKGDIAELDCMKYFTSKGYMVAKPFGDNKRYDLIIEKHNIFERVQVKYVTVKNNIIPIPLESNTKVNGKYKKNKYNKRDIDAIYVYTNENKRYWINIEDFEGQGGVWLRIHSDSKGDLSRVNWASDFELPN